MTKQGRKRPKTRLVKKHAGAVSLSEWSLNALQDVTDERERIEEMVQSLLDDRLGGLLERIETIANRAAEEAIGWALTNEATGVSWDLLPPETPNTDPLDMSLSVAVGSDLDDPVYSFNLRASLIETLEGDDADPDVVRRISAALRDLAEEIEALVPEK